MSSPLMKVRWKSALQKVRPCRVMQALPRRTVPEQMSQRLVCCRRRAVGVADGVVLVLRNQRPRDCDAAAD